MNLLLVCDAYPPMRTSAAVHMHDLAVEFCKQGYEVTVLVPSSQASTIETVQVNGLTILRFHTLNTKDVSYIRRTIAEFIMPYLMYRQFKKLPSYSCEFDGIVWYSPTIFLGPLIRRLKGHFRCKSYLILRDLFPAWALDLGLIKKGPAYFLLKWVESFLYRSADVIGVQAPGNLLYFKKMYKNLPARIEVLWTWAGFPVMKPCSIIVSNTQLSGKKLFVYSGNMGVAQGMDILFDLAIRLKIRQDLGFIFVGRGSEVDRLRGKANELGLKNILFFDEINPDEVPALYSQCHIGLIALDPRHTTHNIPGKFLSYIASGLPVLANVNEGNDLVNLIINERIGKVVCNNSIDSLEQMALKLIAEINQDCGLSFRCRQLALKLFSVDVAVRQIISGLKL